MSEFTAITSQDSIHVKKIQLPTPVLAPDVWGNLKEQPGLVSVQLHLKTGFGTASNADKLDDSTIHYGNLTKRIRSNCGQTFTVLDNILTSVESAIHDMARKEDGTFILTRSVGKLHLPKASMLGPEVVFAAATTYDDTGKSKNVAKSFSINDVTIPTLIGVNAYERAMKQPLVVSFKLEYYTGPSGIAPHQREQKELFDIEKTLVAIIQDTTYETLETLVQFVYTQLVDKLPGAMCPGARFTLRVEKPRAIAMADAPVIEIVRVVPSKRVNETLAVDPSISNGKQAATASAYRSPYTAQNALHIVKPYA